jgi:hypothetical protein
MEEGTSAIPDSPNCDLVRIRFVDNAAATILQAARPVAAPCRSDRLNVSSTKGNCEQYRPVEGLVLASNKRNRLSVLRASC